MITLDKKREQRFTTQVCVIGSGAGGASAALELVSGGAETLLLEAGAHHPPETFDQREASMMPRLYAEGGMRTTSDQSLVILSGQGLGGSTLHNTGLCVPPDEELLHRWECRGALPASKKDVAAMVAKVMERIGATPPPPEHKNTNNRLLERAIAAVGLLAIHPLQNRETCSGCGFCTLGCAYNKKRNVLFSHLEEAVRRGLSIVTDAVATRLVEDQGGVTVEGPGFLVRADHVVIAASAIGSAVLLRRSGLRRNVGDRLSLHPFAPVAGIFEEPVNAWRGVPQTVMAKGPLNHGEAHRWLWLAGAAPPGGVASQLVGDARETLHAMADYSRFAIAGVLLHDRGVGRVRARRDGRAAIRYWPCVEDRVALSKGVAMLADGFLQTGALGVRLPYARLPYLASSASCDPLHSVKIRRHEVALSAVHPQGTVPAGNDARRDAADSTGRLRAARRLWIADGSRFPESVGIPPQVTIMTLATLTARHVLDALSPTL